MVFCRLHPVPIVGSLGLVGGCDGNAFPGIAVPLDIFALLSFVNGSLERIDA